LRFAKAGDRVVVADVDDTERRAHLRDDERCRRGALLVPLEQITEIDGQ